MFCGIRYKIWQPFPSQATEAACCKTKQTAPFYPRFPDPLHNS